MSMIAADTTELAARKVNIFGMSIDNVTFAEAIKLIGERVARREPGYVVTPNVDHVCTIPREPEFREAYENSFLVVVDGMPLLWAASLLGTPLKEKISGSDLVPAVAEFAARQGYSIFLLGAAEGVAEEAAGRLQQKCPGLRIAGCYSPRFGFEKDPAAVDDIVRRLKDAKPDICFIALGSPKQEVFMRHIYAKSGVPVCLGIGASLDFVAGRVRRAPSWLRESGFEWLWRLAMEPRRLWRRYLLKDSYFFVLLWRELRARMRARKTGGPTD